MSESSNYLLVAAIDFGTTYSGYAFSTKAEFMRDPLSINSNQTWNAGTRRLCSLKTPTCLLLDQEKKFLAFGYEAEDKYTELVMDDKHADFYYFEHFKMNLHNNPHLDSQLILENMTGKPVAALDVFALSLEALKNYLFQLIQTQGADIKSNEIQWVLTVPAIWTDKAKQFMRKSAEKAGIPSNQLLIALEPEAASIYYQYWISKTRSLTYESDDQDDDVPNRYMIVDIGGGTADLTVHEKLDDGTLKEICRSNGDSCGGLNVNRAYIKMLEYIMKLQKPLKDELTSINLEDYLDLMRDFEAAKRVFVPNKTEKISINIPYTSMDKLCKSQHNTSLENMLQSSSFSESVVLKGAKMRFDASVIESLFRDTIEKIIALIQNTLERIWVTQIDHIVLVGGFAECSLLKNIVHAKFLDMKKIIIPANCGLSVLQGAVLFGHKPEFIGTRVMQYTYGIGVNKPYNHEKHDKAHFRIHDGQELCRNAFNILVAKNEQVTAGTCVKKRYKSMRFSAENAVQLYYSSVSSPVYTDQTGCIHLGTLSVKIPNPEITYEINVTVIFGMCELQVEATETTSGNKFEASFNTI